MENLAQGLIKELNRNRELLASYREIGPNGAFGAAAIGQDIETGEKSLGEGDVVEMLRAYESLHNNK